MLKGPSYNPMDVANCLMIRRGYKMSGAPQQRSLPNVHNKDDKWDILLEQFSSGLITLTSVPITLISWQSVRIRNNLRDRNNLQSCFKKKPKKVKNIERREKWKSIGILMVIVMWYMRFRYLSNLKCQMQQRSTECHTGILEFYCQLPGFYIKFNLSYRKA